MSYNRQLPFLKGLSAEHRAREAHDEAEHEKRCSVCRNGDRPEPKQFLFALKNDRTGEFLHVIASSREEAAKKLGWPLVDLKYAMLMESGDKRQVMSEETKAQLKSLQEERRALRKVRPKAEGKSKTPEEGTIMSKGTTAALKSLREKDVPTRKEINRWLSRKKLPRESGKNSTRR